MVRVFREGSSGHHDDDAKRKRAMIVLGLSATLIACLTLVAISVLLNIDDGRVALPSRVL